MHFEAYVHLDMQKKNYCTITKSMHLSARAIN
jgi:hypothetical protein